MKFQNFCFKYIPAILLALAFGFASHYAEAQTSWSLLNQNPADSDKDGLSDWKEGNLYGTNKNSADTDGDGQSDFQELMNGRDPNRQNGTLSKHIYVSLRHQELRYYSGPYLMDDFLVSTGVPGRDTPVGEFNVLRKAPTVLYRGPGYNYPNTKWNLSFKPSYYIHGAYWHRNFGNKMSHGCVNVSYADVKQLYDWANVGTPVTILSGDFPSNLDMNLPASSLVLNNRTIYLIANGKKYPFSDMKTFNDLGYSMNNVLKRSIAGFTDGYALNSLSSHVPGTWIINNGTVYYATEDGIIPAPSWDIFLSNGGGGATIVPANSTDMAKTVLPHMTLADVRTNPQ